MPTPMPYPAQTWQQKVKIKTYDGAEVIAYTCNGQSNQKWYLDGQRIRSADTGKCLDIYNGKMKMYSCNQNRGQKFSFIAL
ncbi:RICIN domain-containing protein [Acinetobacter towneri]|uniref:RICIN domain-containing protein n=1 Tax=Acinetobacter towneri TaxID=202956 RepID=UPI003A84B5B9